MKLPFTKYQFLEVFEKYNTAVFPMQILFVLLAVLIVFIVYNRNYKYQRSTLLILAALWLWMGAVYHIGFFSAINSAAYVFGALFILQGLLMLIYGLRKQPSFSFQAKTHSAVSAFMLIYALIIYPAIGFYTDHNYPYSPTFGLPCPTTIFTFAILTLARPRIPLYLAIIPVLWSIIGFSAAFTLGFYEDTALIVSVAVFFVLHFLKYNTSVPHRHEKKIFNR
jgi:hypothetical protein